MAQVPGQPSEDAQRVVQVEGAPGEEEEPQVARTWVAPWVVEEEPGEVRVAPLAEDVEEVRAVSSEVG